MTTIVVVSATVAILFLCVAWTYGYKLGTQDGRFKQARENRRVVEQAVTDKAKAELMTDIWRRRALALLNAREFGSRRGGRK